MSEVFEMAGGFPAEVVLVGNYLPDKQHSMLRYETLLVQGLQAKGVRAKILRPAAKIGGAGRLGPRLEGMLRSFDKFAWFPMTLRRECRRLRNKGGRTLVHLLDQGNGVYVKSVEGLPLLVTCHDLIAIKEMLGQSRALGGKPAGRSYYQKLNLSALKKASWFACVSEATRGDCVSLLGATPSRCAVVANPLDPFFSAPAGDRPAGLPARYLLSLGNAGWYKNRPGALRIYAALRARGYEVPMVVMGGPFSQEETNLVASLGIEGHVLTVWRPDDTAVRAAYAHAEALLFPSLEEGFGWPILEAQAQGCLVFTTGRPPMTEAGGGTAVYLDLSMPAEAAGIVWGHLTGTPHAPHLAAARRAHAESFSVSRFTGEYLALYQSVLQEFPSTTII